MYVPRYEMKNILFFTNSLEDINTKAASSNRKGIKNEERMQTHLMRARAVRSHMTDS